MIDLLLMMIYLLLPMTDLLFFTYYFPTITLTNLWLTYFCFLTIYLLLPLFTIYFSCLLTIYLLLLTYD